MFHSGRNQFREPTEYSAFRLQAPVGAQMRLTVGTAVLDVLALRDAARDEAATEPTTAKKDRIITLIN